MAEKLNIGGSKEPEQRPEIDVENGHLFCTDKNGKRYLVVGVTLVEVD